jgi:hypothetical membrane protein
MTTTRLGEDAAKTARPPASGGATQIAMLIAGVLSTLLYIAADVLGGTRYPGYDFTSQAVSELMAIGAPTERFVDALFIKYGLLALVFGVGVFREGASRSRPLRMAGALLIANAVIGFTLPTLFEMHQRGAGGPRSDTPHIIVTGILVMLQLGAIGLAALALGKRFRLYSFATLLIGMVLGVVSVPYSFRVDAGQPTPSFGILERILIYGFILWVTVLAIVLLQAHLVRLPGSRTPGTAESHE